jgi:hypothetical protein
LAAGSEEKAKMDKTDELPPPSSDWIERVLTTLDAYYDPNGGGVYWAKDDRGVWIRLDVGDIKRRLKDLGYRTTVIENETISQVDKLIIELQKRRSVDFAGPLCGHDKGLYLHRGKRILVTDSPHLIAPVKGDWSTILSVLENLLGDQLDYFHGWMKTALESQRQHVSRPGQALAFAGERDSGKSLVQSLITETLGGRMARPYLYMSGQTAFNGDWFSCEHLAIEDEQPYTDIKSRRNFGTKIKEVTAIDEPNAHKKYREGLTLPVFWRLTISVNDETENLLILPPMDDSIIDKLIIFKAHKKPMPMPTATAQERIEFRTKLSQELPAYIYYLLHEWIIQPGMVSQRYGVIHYQHPDILHELGELAPETRLLQLIDTEIFAIPQTDSWEGTSLQLEQKLTSYGSSVRRQAYALLDWQGACGTCLGRLKKQHPARFSYKKGHRDRFWTIEPPPSAPGAAP